MRLRLAALLAAAAALMAGPALADAPEGRWYAVQLHAHSNYSDGNHSIADMLRFAKEGGLDALALTEHNTKAHLADPAFATAHDVLLIPGYEWTSHGENDPNEHGHANIWGLTANTPILPPTTPYRKLIAEAESQGVVLGVNHPTEPRFPWPLADLGPVTAMEVWHWDYHLNEDPNTPLPANVHRRHHNWADFLVRNARAIALWEAALKRGQRVTPVAVADFHIGFFQRIERPCTLVWSREKSVEGLLAGLKAGHVVLAESPTGPRVELWGDADGDGTFEALPGDTVPQGAALEVRVSRGAGLTLQVFDADGRVIERTISEDEHHERLEARSTGYYWARLDADHWWNPLKAMSGAMYVSRP